MSEKTLTNILNEPISDVFRLEVPKYKKEPTAKPKTILQRIAESDQTAVNECLENYGNYIWAMAKKCCKDQIETEELVQKIFFDIWKNAERFDAENSDEKTFIAGLLLRRTLNKTNKGKNNEIF
ncbi:MAG: hypothetical protein LUM44_02220 [Pyrinomonadaceae bacterium]|nr:hypothetical protein [Pyrinomonadaceae bacterium]